MFDTALIVIDLQRDYFSGGKFPAGETSDLSTGAEQPVRL